MFDVNGYHESVIPVKKCIAFVSNKYFPLQTILKTSSIFDGKDVHMEQTHGNQFYDLSHSSENYIANVDALITQKKQQLLIVRTADCLPILIYHKSAIAAVHAGRKSLESNLLANVLVYLKNKIHALNDLYIYFGPHITQPYYEINKETKETYCLKSKAIDQIFTIYNRKSVKIVDSKLCTVRNNHLFFSYRKEKQTDQRFHSGIMMV
jgi:YfiH family protein